MARPLFIDSIEAAVDHVLDTVSGDIVLGIPLAIGKPNPFVNALYRRIKANPARRLRIVTALSLEKPVGKSELEQHFLGPLVERVFEDYPDLAYVKDLRAGTLPPNIEVREFFMKTGDYLGNLAAQQGDRTGDLVARLRQDLAGLAGVGQKPEGVLDHYHGAVDHQRFDRRDRVARRRDAAPRHSRLRCRAPLAATRRALRARARRGLARRDFRHARRR